MKSKRTKACEISPKVREAVEKRDSICGYPCCVFCGTSRNVRGEAHIVRRSQGGLGIEQNIVTVCRRCHERFDENPEYRKKYMEYITNYMKQYYSDWNMDDLVYKKGMGI